MLLIPLRHDNMEGRRWPVISIALVILNFGIFLATKGQIENESPQRAEVRAHIILLAATHPELTLPPNAEELVTNFKKRDPATWTQAQSQTREMADAWDVKMRMMEDEAGLQREMDFLAEQWATLDKSSFVTQYAFVPSHPTGISYVTANFLHGGWLHLIGNMWFLWLAGAILEDTWGRIIYPIFYLAAGAAALQFHAWFNPDSLAATLGASGAVAALMGAFLVRFPTTKIDVAVVIGLRSLTNLALGKGIRFKAASYWLLPFWVLMEVFSGALFGGYSGVAHWAHVGGFVFGAVAALGLRYSGLEHKANAAIESKVSWTADPEIVQATENMEHGKLDEAIATLKSYVAKKPDSVEAYTLLQQICWRKNDVPAYREAIVKLCQLHLKAHDLDAAWQDYQEYTNSGGDPIPASAWLELCRAAEGKEDYERAAVEYEKLASAHPTQKQSLLALMAAGRLSLKKLNRPSEALRFYQAAARSQVPHLDWDSNIQAGLQEAQKALAGSQIPALKP
ncbi:MAG TPA: rhomboid family intramembrane serine protease [Candidatus Acidoferrum sp.]|nr:rhomboid family intramembrane serine protease [Candidatus Acidoferrum sp.]